GKPMIVLLAKSRLLEGKQQEFLSIAKKLVEATRQESGCVYYDLVQEDERTFCFVEKYLDEAAVEAHKNSPHFQTYVPMMNDLREGAPEVTTCVTVDF
ncbi:MAG: putative quinol monooxygenase, partial [Bacillota bacterium]|nr:putative quinol monooxygenase [Bacillota bacterium]